MTRSPRGPIPKRLGGCTIQHEHIKRRSRLQVVGTPERCRVLQPRPMDDVDGISSRSSTIKSKYSEDFPAFRTCIVDHSDCLLTGR